MTPFGPRPTRSAIVLAALLVGLSVGCGGPGPYDTVGGKGTIRYDDGSNIPAGRIELIFISQQPPLDAKTHPRQGVAEVNVADGSFTVTTYEANDGLIRGEHVVLAKSIAPGGGYTPAIPAEYRSASTTPLSVDAQGQAIELVVPRPGGA